MRGSSRVGWFMGSPSFPPRLRGGQGGVFLQVRGKSKEPHPALPEVGEGEAGPRNDEGYQFVFAVRPFFTTIPPFITNFTRCISERSATGFPDTAMMSANLPFSMLAMWFSQS